jgi:serine/threonine protein kinase
MQPGCAGKFDLRRVKIYHRQSRYSDLGFYCPEIRLMLEKGDKIGEYVLLSKVGSGGFGDVWKAEKRTALDVNHFALKFFRPKDNRLDLDKISKELAVWKKLRGLGNIISVIELDRFDDYVYLVSDFADGGSLEDWLNTHDGKAPSEREAVRITLEILTGLENLHEKGFVHRDLKPDNILIMNDKFCLADFGVSREVKTHSKATGTAGTIEYMPPEAFEKNPSVTPQTDIWAIGVILQRLLTGELSFPYEMPALMLAILQDEPEPMPETITLGSREIVKKALQKKREDRFQTAGEMREALKNPAQFLAAITEKHSGTVVDEDFDRTKVMEGEPIPEGQIPETEKKRQAEQERLRRDAEEKQRQEIIELERARQWRELEAEKERQRLHDERETRPKAELKRQPDDKFNDFLNDAFNEKSPENETKDQPNQSQSTQFKPNYEPQKSGDWNWLLGLAIALPIGLLLIAYSNSGVKLPANNSIKNNVVNKPSNLVNVGSKNAANKGGNTVFIGSNSVPNLANLITNFTSKSADDYFKLGLDCELKKDNDCAYNNYSKAIELRSNFANAYAGRGLAFFNRGDYDQAIRDYTKAIDLDPNGSMAYNNRGVAYDRKGYYGQAIADYRKSLQINPDNQNAKDNLEKSLAASK